MRNEQVCGGWPCRDGLLSWGWYRMHQGERQNQKGLERDVGEIGFQAMVRWFIFYKHCRDPALLSRDGQRPMFYELWTGKQYPRETSVGRHGRMRRSHQGKLSHDLTTPFTRCLLQRVREMPGKFMPWDFSKQRLRQLQHQMRVSLRGAPTFKPRLPELWRTLENWCWLGNHSELWISTWALLGRRRPTLTCLVFSASRM